MFKSWSKKNKIKAVFKLEFQATQGSSKSGFLGEASIDFADFVAEAEPITVSLPLKFANSGVVLHVTIQNVEGYTAERIGEDNGAEELYNDTTLRHQLSFGSTEESYNVEENGNMAKTRSGYSEQNASNGISPGVASWEDPYSFRNTSLPSSKGTGEATENQVHKRSNTNWSLGSGSDGSLNSLEDSLPRFQGHSDNTTEKLKSEITSLKRQAEVSDLELQSLRKQIEKESTRGQNLSRQIISLREERDVFKLKYEKLQSQQSYNDESKASRALKSEIEDTRIQLEAVKEELVYEKETSANLQLQLHKTQSSNSELLLAVTDLEAMLEQKNKEMSDLSTNVKSQNSTSQRGHARELDFLRQKIADQNGEINMYCKQNEELNEHIKELTLEYDLLKKENVDITLRLKQDEVQHLKLQNEHSASLVTIQQLESQVERLEERIKMLEDEHSTSLVYIKELENEVKSLEKELKMQEEKFEDDMRAIQRAKAEQEERASQAEEALKKTRHNNAVASERFQEEYRLLSVEMAAKVEENEKMNDKAAAEADELRQKNRLIEEMLQKCNQELRLISDQHELKQQELLKQIDSKGKAMEHMSHELEVKSKQLEEAKRQRDEKEAAFSKQIQLLRSQIKTLLAEECTLSKSKLKKNTAEMVRIDAQTTNDEEMVLSTLLSEVEIFKVQHNETKQSLHKEQVEKEGMKKQISQLEGELKKKEAELSAMEKKIRNNKGRDYAAPLSSAKAQIKKSKPEIEKGTDAGSKSAKNQDSEVRMHELLNEVSALKEKNKTMESELKEMEDRYSEISLKFAEVEGERQQLVMAVRNLKNGKKN